MMKKRSILFLLSVWFVGGLFAQSSENLTRNVLVTVPENEIVNYGEFQVELQKTTDYRETQEGFWFSYLYRTVNKYNQVQNVFSNSRALFLNRDLRVRMYRTGPTLEQSIFVLKSMEKTASDIGYGMEAVRAYGITYAVCDTVVSINDDGFVFRSNGVYKYSHYKANMAEQTETIPVTWLERKVYDGSDNGMPVEKKVMFSHLVKGDVYHESWDGHYYFLHRDRFMPFTILVVDNKAIELFDVYKDEDLRLKFSYNGKHWMAVGKECYWVDGVMRSVEGFEITDFVVTNDGHYAYKACPKESDKRKEVVVADGQILRRNAQVCYFGLNGEGTLKFRFMSSGRVLEYENDQVTDVSSALTYVHYTDNPFHDQPVVVQSNDGHKLSYQKDVPGVVIDGERITESVPCYAIYDERNHAFVWNAIEPNGDKLDLVIYRYNIVNNFFKNLFK